MNGETGSMANLYGMRNMSNPYFNGMLSQSQASIAAEQIEAQRKLYMAQSNAVKPTGGTSMFKNIGDQVSAFIKDYRDPLLWAAILFAVDHYCLEGAFRDRLKRIFERGVKMAEDKLDALAK